MAAGAAWYRNLLLRELLQEAKNTRARARARDFEHQYQHQHQHQHQQWRWRAVVMSQAALDAAAERRRKKRMMKMQAPMEAVARNREWSRHYAERNRDRTPDGTSAMFPERSQLHIKIQNLNRSGELKNAVDAALHAFSRGPRLRPHLFTVCCILGHLHRAGLHDQVFEFFDFVMQQARLVPNVVLFNIVLASHCQRLDLPGAFGILDMIAKAEISPSHVTFSHLMKAHFKLKKYEDVMKLFRQMLETCYGADPPTYAATIEGFVNGDAIAQAEELYLEMRRRGSLFSEPVFCNLIRGFFAAGEVQKALDVFEFIPEKVPRTVMSYNAVMNGYCKAGQIQEALAFYEKLKESDLQPNAGSYAVIMNCHLVQEQLEEAERLFRSILDNGCLLEAVAYNVLLEAYFNKGMFKQAEKLLDEMVNQHHEADSTTYTLFVDGYSKQGKIDSAFELFKRMLDAGFKPDVAIWNLWFGILCDAGRNGESLQLFRQMWEGQQCPDLTTYKILAEGFSREGRVVEVKNVFQEVVAVGRPKLGDELSSAINAYIVEPFKKITQTTETAECSSANAQDQDLENRIEEESNMEATM